MLGSRSDPSPHRLLMRQKVQVLNGMFERVMMTWHLLFRLSAAAAAAGKVMIVAAAIPLMADAEQVCLRQKRNCFDPLKGG